MTPGVPPKSGGSPPPGVASAYPLKAAAAALRFDERRLLAWCRAGYVYSFQPGDRAKRYIPTPEIERLAALMLTAPDWEAAIDADTA